jgi:NitT/TauT family transport system substrate-binding protein
MENTIEPHDSGGNGRLLRRRSLILGAAALSIPGIGLTQGRSLKKVVYVPPFTGLISFAPDYVAKAAGFFEREGLDVTIEGTKGAMQSLQQILAGQALISRAGSPEIMKAILNQNAPLVAVGTICQGSPLCVMSMKSAPVLTPGDMKGKVIGLPSKGGTAENVLDIMLLQHNVDPATVRREVIGESPGSFGLIEAGRIHAFIAGTSTRAGLEVLKAPMEWFNVDKFAPLPGQVYSVTQDTLRTEGDTIVRFLRAIKQAVDFMVADQSKDKTLDLLGQFSLPALKNRELARADVKANVELWLDAGPDQVLRNVPERWQKGRDLLAKSGAIKPGSATGLYTNELVNKALA